MIVSNSMKTYQRALPQREQPSVKSDECQSQDPTDTVTFSQKDNSAGGLITMICGLMIGGGIATAFPIVGGAVAIGSIYAGLAMASS